jgi:hypothetical protein
VRQTIRSSKILSNQHRLLNGNSPTALATVGLLGGGANRRLLWASKGLRAKRNRIEEAASGFQELGLNRVPVTAPAGAEELAAAEKEDEHDYAGRGEGEAKDRGAVRHPKVLGEKVVEELADFVLHAHHSAMTMPTGRNAAIRLVWTGTSRRGFYGCFQR